MKTSRQIHGEKKKQRKEIIRHTILMPLKAPAVSQNTERPKVVGTGNAA